MPENLYIHFPFCRSRCSYCSLFSRVGKSAADRTAYVQRLAQALKKAPRFRTIYFGGGTPALCDLTPLLKTLAADEFTIELHPLDVTDELLKTLRDGGVNRISMGVQSLDDAILSHMERGYKLDDAERAFASVRRVFDNAGIDLIVGYPGETAAITPQHARLAQWGLKHCSVYSLQNERHLPHAIDDETTLDRLRETAVFLNTLGLKRYEISNYAVPGFECRHNLAVWRGEDYLGLGEGACGRIGLKRTRNAQTLEPPADAETVTLASDEKERRLFRLRTRDGLDTTGHPEWLPMLKAFTAEGLLTEEGPVYRLTERGTEVCDSILAELV